MRVLRRTIAVLVAFVALAEPAHAQLGSLGSRLQHALTGAHARSAAVAVDLTTGKLAYARNALMPLAPASNEKLVVTYAALAELGPAFQFETDVLGAGGADGPAWRGDLVLKGYGDPTLSSSDLASLARQVRSTGITHVAGDIVGDESWFDSRRTAPGWKPAFFIRECPPLSALVVDRARIGRVVSSQPALAAAELFRKALVRAGITVSGRAALGTVTTDAELVASVSSPPLAAIVRWMDLVSDNFEAEMLLKELGAVEFGEGTTAGGAAVARRVLVESGIPIARVRIVDGSGLSSLDRLTARTLVALLAAMWNDRTTRPLLLRSLPVAGVSGTLAHRMRASAAYRRVRAKTGTTSIASALSGFAGSRYAFAVLHNGRPLALWSARVAQDRFAAVLAAAAALP
jgi:D-alanyl-D-alanine carboxypeptidase/D-alanyl-D-alanine-endopeptidase (penicillin-binding protein 4)